MWSRDQPASGAVVLRCGGLCLDEIRREKRDRRGWGVEK